MHTKHGIRILIRDCEEMGTLEVSPGRRAIDTLSSVGCAGNPGIMVRQELHV